MDFTVQLNSSVSVAGLACQHTNASAVLLLLLLLLLLVRAGGCLHLRLQAIARASMVRRQVYEIKVLAPLLSLCLQKRAALIAARYTSPPHA